MDKEMIENASISENEKSWLDRMFSRQFLYKNEIIEQMNNSVIVREYKDTFLALKFEVDRSLPPLKMKVRIPIEMRVYKSGQTPIQFLLHVVHGYVDELEVFYADLTPISRNLEINEDKIEIIIDEDVAWQQ